MATNLPEPRQLRQRLTTAINDAVAADGRLPTAPVLAQRVGVSRSLASAALRFWFEADPCFAGFGNVKS